jgi:hypothetical protein
LFSLGIFRAAMFAEPAVTEIEEMIGLIQEDIRTESGSDRVNPTTETMMLKPGRYRSRF